MKLLPGAVVPDAKVRDYLLDAGNVQNRGKAGLFGPFGFNRDEWQILATALRCHPIDNDVAEEKLSPHGTKYVVRCNLVSPDGRNPCITTVWIVDAGASIPRLVTAY